MPILAGAAFLAVLLLIGMDWGRSLSEMRRSETGVRDHFVFAEGAHLPQALADENERRTLKLIVATPDFFVILSTDGKTTWRVATRDVELMETTR